MSGGTTKPDPYYQKNPPKKRAKVRYGKDRKWEKQKKKPTELPPWKPSGPVKMAPLPPLRNLGGGRNKSKLLWYICDNCSGYFPAKTKDTKRHAHAFCKPECHGEWHGNNLKGRSMPYETRKKMSDTKMGRTKKKQVRSKAPSGECQSSGYRNPKWYKEAKDQAEAYRRSGEWKRTSKRIMKRDGHTCQACGTTRKQVKQMDAHHVKKLADWMYEGNDPSDYPDNLLATLCQKCHGHTEGQKSEYKWPKSARDT